eukprot:jgi/Chrzof1/9575/Cz04g08030.t1
MDHVAGSVVFVVALGLAWACLVSSRDKKRVRPSQSSVMPHPVPTAVPDSCTGSSTVQDKHSKRQSCKDNGTPLYIWPHGSYSCLPHKGPHLLAVGLHEAVWSAMLSTPPVGLIGLAASRSPPVKKLRVSLSHVYYNPDHCHPAGLAAECAANQCSTAAGKLCQEERGSSQQECTSDDDVKQPCTGNWCCPSCGYAAALPPTLDPHKSEVDNAQHAASLVNTRTALAENQQPSLDAWVHVTAVAEVQHATKDAAFGSLAKPVDNHSALSPSDEGTRLTPQLAHHAALCHIHDAAGQQSWQDSNTAPQVRTDITLSTPEHAEGTQGSPSVTVPSQQSPVPPQQLSAPQPSDSSTVLPCSSTRHQPTSINNQNQRMSPEDATVHESNSSSDAATAALRPLTHDTQAVGGAPKLGVTSSAPAPAIELAQVKGEHLQDEGCKEVAWCEVQLWQQQLGSIQAHLADIQTLKQAAKDGLLEQLQDLLCQLSNKETTASKPHGGCKAPIRDVTERQKCHQLSGDQLLSVNSMQQDEHSPPAYTGDAMQQTGDQPKAEQHMQQPTTDRQLQPSKDSDASGQLPAPNTASSDSTTQAMTHRIKDLEGQLVAHQEKLANLEEQMQADADSWQWHIQQLDMHNKQLQKELADSHTQLTKASAELQAAENNWQAQVLAMQQQVVDQAAAHAKQQQALPDECCEAADVKQLEAKAADAVQQVLAANVEVQSLQQQLASMQQSNAQLGGELLAVQSQLEGKARQLSHAQSEVAMLNATVLELHAELASIHDSLAVDSKHSMQPSRGHDVVVGNGLETSNSQQAMAQPTLLTGRQTANCTDQVGAQAAQQAALSANTSTDSLLEANKVLQQQIAELKSELQVQSSEVASVIAQERHMNESNSMLQQQLTNLQAQLHTAVTSAASEAAAAMADMETLSEAKAHVEAQLAEALQQLTISQASSVDYARQISGIEQDLANVMSHMKGVSALVEQYDLSSDPSNQLQAQIKALHCKLHSMAVCTADHQVQTCIDQGFDRLSYSDVDVHSTSQVSSLYAHPMLPESSQQQKAQLMLADKAVEAINNPQAIGATIFSASHLQQEVVALQSELDTKAEFVIRVTTERDLLVSSRIQLQQRINQLEAAVNNQIQSVASITAERDTLLSSSNQLQQDISTLQSQLDSKTQDVASITAERDTLLSSSSQLQQDISTLQSQLDIKTQDVASITAERDTLLISSSQLQQDISTLQSQLDIKSQDVASITAERDTLLMSSNQLQQDISTLQSQLDIKTQDVASITAERDTVLSSSNQLQQGISALQSQLDIKTQDVASITAERYTLLISSSQLQQDISTLQSQLDIKTQDMASITAERDMLLNNSNQLQQDISSLQSQLDSKTQDAASIAAERDTVLSSSNQLQQDISSLQSQLDSKTQDAASIAAERDTVLSSSNELQQDINALQSQLDIKTQDVASMTAERDTLLISSSQLQQDISTLQSQLDIKTQDVASNTAERDTLLISSSQLQQDISTLQSQLDIKSQDVASIAAERDTVLSSSNQLQQDISALQSQLDSKTQDVASITAERDTLLSSSSQLQQDISTLQSQLDSKTHDAASIAAERDTVLSSSNQLQQAISTLQSQLDIKTQDVASITAERDTLLISSSQLQQDISTLQSQLDIKSQDVASITAERDTLLSSSNQLQQDISTLQSQLDIKTQDVASITAERDTLLSSSSQLQQDISTLQSQLDSKTQDVASITAERDTLLSSSSQLQQDISTLQSQLDIKTQDVASITAERDTLLSSSNQLQQAICTVQSQLDIKTQDVASITAERDTLLISSSQLQQDISTLQSQLDIKTQDVASITAERDTLLISSSQLQQDISTLQSQLDIKSQDVASITAERDTVLSSSNQLQQDISTVQSQLMIYMSNFEKLTASSVQLLQALNDATAQLNSLRTVHASITADNATLASSFSQQQTVNKKLDILTAERHALLSSSQQLQQDKTVLQDELNNTTETLASMSAQHNQLQQSISTLQSELISKAESLASITAERDALVSSSHQLQQDKIVLQDELNNTTETLASMCAQHNQLQQSISALQSELASKAESLASITAETDALVSSSHQLQQDKIVLQDELNNTTETLASMCAQHNQLQQSISTLQSELASIAESLASITAERDALLSSSHQLEQLLQEHQSLLDIKSMEFAYASLDHESVSKTCEELQQEVHMLQAQVTDHKTQIAKITAHHHAGLLTNNQLEQQAQQLQAQIDGHKEEMGALVLEREMLANCSEKLQGQIYEFQSQLDSKTREAKALTAERNSLIEDSRHLQQQLHTSQQQLTSMEAQHAALSATTAQLQQQVTDLVEKLNAKIPHAAVQATSELHSSGIQESPNSTHQRDAQPANATTLPIALQAQLGYVQQLLKGANQKIINRRAEIAEITIRWERMAAEKDAVAAANTQLQHQVHIATAGIAVIRQQLQGVTTAHQHLKKQLKLVLSHLGSSAADIDTLQQGLQRIHSRSISMLDHDTSPPSGGAVMQQQAKSADADALSPPSIDAAAQLQKQLVVAQQQVEHMKQMLLKQQKDHALEMDQLCHSMQFLTRRLSEDNKELYDMVELVGAAPEPLGQLPTAKSEPPQHLLALLPLGKLTSADSGPILAHADIAAGAQAVHDTTHSETQDSQQQGLVVQLQAEDVADRVGMSDLLSPVGEEPSRHFETNSLTDIPMCEDAAKYLQDFIACQVLHQPSQEEADALRNIEHILGTLSAGAASSSIAVDGANPLQLPDCMGFPASSQHAAGNQMQCMSECHTPFAQLADMVWLPAQDHDSYSHRMPNQAAPTQFMASIPGVVSQGGEASDPQLPQIPMMGATADLPDIWRIALGGQDMCHMRQTQNPEMDDSCQFVDMPMVQTPTNSSRQEHQSATEGHVRRPYRPLSETPLG